MYGIDRHIGSCLSVSTGDARDCSCERSIRAWGGYVNAALLAVVGIGIAVAAYHRYYNPREVFGEAVIAAAFLGAMLNFWQHHELEHGHEREIARYWRILGIGTLTFLMLFFVGVWSGSLSLESDAWHVFVDNGAVIISIIIASLVPERSDRTHVTHGLVSAHVLSDFLQNVAVVGTGIWIAYTQEYIVDSITSAAIAALLLIWAMYYAVQSHRGTYAQTPHHIGHHH